jgi:ribosomal protein S18 acetylase RimI-like enzyme
MVADGPPLPAAPEGRRRPAEITAEDVRWLAWHEARAHALTSREVRDLGDAWLLHDPTDREPFWNRIAGVVWPDEPAAFDRRLTEVLALFAGLDRIPHVWAFPGFDEPADLVERLLAFGFEDHGGGLMMAFDPARDVGAATVPPDADGRHVSVERLHRLVGEPAQDAARAMTEVLVSSFAVEPERRIAIELETVMGLSTDAYHAILVRVDGEPAAVARRTTFAGGSYLSSIGTAPGFRGLGLGRLVTALAVADAVRDRSHWIYLGVFEENDIAQGLYRSLGFEQVGGLNPDLLLRP